ncbi:MAG: acetate/propionate family kinase [Gemmatimonadetes bacterium]|jgi:acetate kinase|nr:acetate/propionate family kinase [Gemmatimonadota bacterium]MBT6150123.1 acetate/propionate family kinase [Gemmatimonadota bacterium]MBT7860320.1 acetate/propionate family kinase [Gemmatimonadota bacterium]
MIQESKKTRTTLVLNAGSSTLKFAVYDGELTRRIRGTVDWAGADGQATLEVHIDDAVETRSLNVKGHGDAASAVIDLLAEHPDLRDGLVAVGHRVVHGGEDFHAPTPIDTTVRQRIDALSHLAPLHNPPALAAIDAARAAIDLPNVAVFDTAFFAPLEPAAYMYALPWEWYEQYGVRRYGFHGTSHANAVERCHEILDARQLRVVCCHLGSGCSAAAAIGNKAVATTMGFTPLEGLMMGTRPGSIDPGILLHVARVGQMDTDAIDQALNRGSGLLGVSGVSSDYRQVCAAAAEGHERAQLALDLYESRIIRVVGALTAELGGLDALLFTAGVGEHAHALRTRLCERLSFLGIELDEAANVAGASEGDAVITSEESRVKVLVIRCREEMRIARETFSVVGDSLADPRGAGEVTPAATGS